MNTRIKLFLAALGISAGVGLYYGTLESANAQFAPGPGGSGSVSSVAVTMPGEFTVSGSPVTTAGIIAVTKASQSENTFYAGPSSGSGLPTFRQLSSRDSGSLADWRVQSTSAGVAYRFNTQSGDSFANSLATAYKIGTNSVGGSLGFFASPIGVQSAPITFNTGATLSPTGLFDFPIGITVPKRTAGDSTANAANTSFVTGAIATAVTPLAPKASPALTGTPTAPTPSPADNSTKIATTAYVDGGISTAVTPLAPKASPAFTGTPTAPTQSPGDNSTKLATTAYVDAATAGSRVCTTPVTLASSTVNIATGIPAGVTSLEIVMAGGSNGNGGLQFSTGGTFGGSYSGAYSLQTTSLSSQGGWSGSITVSSGNFGMTGVVRAVKNPSNNTWIVSSTTSASDGTLQSAGSVAMSGALDGVRITGSGNYSGTAFVCYE